MTSISRVVDRMRQEYAAANYRRNNALTKASELEAQAGRLRDTADYEQGIAHEVRLAMLAYGIDPQEG